MAETNTTTSGNITELIKLLRNAKLLEIITQLNAFQISLNTLSSQCANISESLKEELEFNQRLLRVAEGYIQNSTRLTQIANSLQAINLPIFQPRITAIENTQVTMQADISSIKGMMIEMFKAFKGFSFSTPRYVVVWKKPPSYTEGEKLSIVNITKEPEVNDVEKEHEVANEYEPVQEPQVSEPIPITIVRPLTKPAPELEIIRTSSRLQLTDTILKVQIPQPESPQATPKPDRGKGKVTDADESPPKLVKSSTKVWPDPDAPILVPYEIPRKMYQLIEEQIQGHLDKEEKLEKATREARLSKPELIKVLHEEATKAEVDPKALASKEGGQEFIKIQDAEIKLEPEVRIPELECNRSLPKGVPFVNNLVIEHPKNGLFFIDVFGDEAFQRMNDIHKVLFNIKELIDSHLDKEKLKSKKVKLEVVGYSMS
ncbi:hypothetical protein Tco_1267369 [Tanacetum coccineum]